MDGLPDSFKKPFLWDLLPFFHAYVGSLAGDHKPRGWSHLERRPDEVERASH